MVWLSTDTAGEVQRFYAEKRFEYTLSLFALLHKLLKIRMRIRIMKFSFSEFWYTKIKIHMIVKYINFVIVFNLFYSLLSAESVKALQCVNFYSVLIEIAADDEDILKKIWHFTTLWVLKLQNKTNLFIFVIMDTIERRIAHFLTNKNLSFVSFFQFSHSVFWSE